MTLWGAELRREAEESRDLAASATAERLAVLATFDPERIDETGLPAILRALATPLDTRPRGRKRHRRAAGDQERGWALTERARVQILERLLRERGPEGLAEVRRGLEAHFDTPLQRALDAVVVGAPLPLAERTAEECVEALTVWRWMTRASAFAGTSLVFDLGPSPEEIRGRLAHLELVRPLDKLLVTGCVGRAAELKRLRDWRQQGPDKGSLFDYPPAVVYGIGGMGKSTLVASFVKELYDATEQGQPRPWAYVDFDRPIFRSHRPDPVMEEILLQVATQFPDYRLLIDSATETARRASDGAGLESVDTTDSYETVGAALAEVIRQIAPGEPFVVVLDTFEEVQNAGKNDYGSSFAEEMLEAFSGLGHDLGKLRLVISSRVPPAVDWLEVPESHKFLVEELEAGPASELLELFIRRRDPGMLPLPEGLALDVIDLVGGSPLTLKLAARVLAEQGREAIEDAARRAVALGAVRSEFVRGFLYRRIIEHVTPEDPSLREPLREVARAALATRRVTRESLRDVLLPALGKAPDDFWKMTLFEALEQVVSLLERDGDVLVLHEDLRRPALAALRFDQPELVEAVQPLAVEHFEGLPADWAPAEAVYHRLMSGEPAYQLADRMTPAVRQSLQRSLADLPPEAARFLRVREGEAPPDLQAAAAARRLEQDVRSRAESALASGDLETARAALAEVSLRLPASQLYRVESRLREAEGKLVDAIRAQELDCSAALEEALPHRFAASAVRLAELHEKLGHYSESANALLQAETDALLHGYLALRVELKLSRLNVAERGGTWTREAQAREEAAARQLLMRLPAKSRENSVLIRLSAAALGKDEPERIELALGRVGIGAELSPEAAAEVAAAMADIDAPDATVAELLEGVGDLEQHLLKVGPQAETLLLDIFVAAHRDKQLGVTEAIRRIYLWWGITRSSGEVEEDEPLAFGAEALDWSRQRTRDFAKVLSAAYPSSSHVLRLADIAGLDPESVTVHKRSRSTIAEIIDQASRRGRLPKLVQAAIDDRETAAFHDRLRGFI